MSSKIYPARVSGRFKRRRAWLSVFLLALFVALPWVRLDGRQALLLDLPHGRFAIAGVRFWAHDTPLLLGVVFSLVLSIAFVTSIWGRAWCGWACPQTVFVEQVFRRIETWIEGDSVTRRRRDSGSWTLDKAWRKALKWAVYGWIAAVLSHSFLAYFIGTEELGRMMAQAPSQNPLAFAAMAAIAGAVLFDFGWFRERFCTQVCPYGRFQSVLMDERSLAVTYDRARGEPRRLAPPPEAKRGDCIDCGRCVQVCPTGIDIRNGLQLECVACTACIDACDAVMDKVSKPRGLIRYSASTEPSGWRTRYRSMAYLALLAVPLTTLGFALQGRQPLAISVTRSTGEPYQRLGATGEIANSFRVELHNQTFDPIRVAPGVSPELQLVAPSLPAEIAPGVTLRLDVFAKFLATRIPNGHGKGKIAVSATSAAWPGTREFSQEVPLVGPGVSP